MDRPLLAPDPPPPTLDIRRDGNGAIIHVGFADGREADIYVINGLNVAGAVLPGRVVVAQGGLALTSVVVEQLELVGAEPDPRD